MPCVPCEAKKRMDQQSAAAVEQNEEVRKKTQALWDDGKIDDEQAEAILGPLMGAERAFIDHNRLAVESSKKALAAARDLAAGE